MPKKKQKSIWIEITQEEIKDIAKAAPWDSTPLYLYSIENI